MTADRLPAHTRLLIAGDGASSLGTGLVLPLTLIYLHQVRGIGPRPSSHPGPAGGRHPSGRSVGFAEHRPPELLPPAYSRIMNLTCT